MRFGSWMIGKEKQQLALRELGEDVGKKTEGLLKRSSYGGVGGVAGCLV